MAKKEFAMHLINLLRKWTNILVIPFPSISISWTIVLKFNFRVLTSTEIYKTIDSLENNKSLVPRFVHACALKAAKYAIGIHLQYFK